MSAQRLRVFGRFDPAAADPAERLRTWLTQPGAVGVRLTFFGPSAVGDDGLLGLEPFWNACERLATPVAVFAPDNLTDLVRVLERHPRLRLVVDHLGLGVYPGCVDPLAGLSILPEFAAFEHVRVKISGLPEISGEGFPFRDVRDHLADAVSRFGADRLIWGSNHPVVLAACTYAESLEYLEDCEFLSSEQLAWLLGGTLREFAGRRLAGVTAAAGPAANLWTDLQRTCAAGSRFAADRVNTAPRCVPYSSPPMTDPMRSPSPTFPSRSEAPTRCSSTSARSGSTSPTC